MAKLSDRDDAAPREGEQEIIDTAVMTLLTTSEERREAMMELLSMTFAREMRQHWPDMPGRESSPGPPSWCRTCASASPTSGRSAAPIWVPHDGAAVT